MSELWETLTTGLIVSLIFIAVSYFFWRRYDKPTPLMIERQEEKQRLKEEQRTWRQVEAKMRAEQEEAELKAAYEQRKAAERARAMVPEVGEVSEAWKSLGVSPLDAEPTPTFTATGEDANAGNTPVDQTDMAETVEDDSDVLNAADLVQVRQDRGVDPSVEAPDWELIDKLHEIAEKDEIEVPNVPEAPDLDAVVQEEEPLLETDSEPEPTTQPKLEPDTEQTVEATDIDAESSLVASPEPVAEPAPQQPAAEQPAPDPAPPVDDGVVTWGLAEGEDLWAGTSWEEE